MEIVEKAASLYQQNGCTLVIGLGGGSSIDGAKTVSLIASRKEVLENMVRGRRSKGRLSPSMHSNDSRNRI